MAIDASEDIAKAVCSDKFDAASGEVSASLFKGSGSSVSRLSLCPLEDTWEMFRYRLRKATTAHLGTGWRDQRRAFGGSRPEFRRQSNNAHCGSRAVGRLSFPRRDSPEDLTRLIERDRQESDFEKGKLISVIRHSPRHETHLRFRHHRLSSLPGDAGVRDHRRGGAGYRRAAV